MATSAGEETPVETPEPKPKGSPLTPGQRLALRKAAKAKRKAEEKGKDDEAEEIVEEVEKAAEEFSDFWNDNQQKITAGILVALAVSVGALLFSRQQASGHAGEAAALQTAVETAAAQVDAEGATAGDDDVDPVFASIEDRSTKAIESYTALQKAHSGSPAAAWGLLGQGTASFEAGDYAAAQEAFGKALAQDGTGDAVAARAVEGIALSLEAAGKPDEAAAKLQELLALGDGAFADQADYHLARLKLAKGDVAAAKDLLKGAYDRLSSPEPGTPARPYLKNQVELRLMEIDSSLVDRAAPSAGFGGPGGGMSPEKLQELIKQLQSKQAPAGSP